MTDKVTPESLRQYIGKYVYASRPRTACESKIMAPFEEGHRFSFGGVVVSVDDERVSRTVTYGSLPGSPAETFEGVCLVVDYGYEFLITDDTTITVAEYLVESFINANRDAFCSVCERRKIRAGDRIGILVDAVNINQRKGKACTECTEKIANGEL